MILTVYSHCGLSSVPVLGTWVYGFYMPLFFSLSGILLKSEKYTWDVFLRRRWKTLYRPYLIFSVTLAILCFPLHTSDFSWFYNNLIINGWGGYALWFIPVSAIAELLFFAISKLTSNQVIHGLIAVVCMFLGYVLYKLDYPNPYNWALVPTAMAFYALGNIFRHYMDMYLFHVYRKILSFSYKNDSEICGQKHIFHRCISSDNIVISTL